MDVLSVYINEIKLGEMLFDGTNYIFKANENNIEKANKKGYTPFLFGCEKSWISETLLLAFQDFIPADEQIDLIEMAGIEQSDNDYIKLCKMAALNLAKPNFHIEID